MVVTGDPACRIQTTLTFLLDVEFGEPQMIQILADSEDFPYGMGLDVRGPIIQERSGDETPLGNALTAIEQQPLVSCWARLGQAQRKPFLSDFATSNANDSPSHVVVWSQSITQNAPLDDLRGRVCRTYSDPSGCSC